MLHRPGRNVSKDLDRIRSVSSMLNRRISELGQHPSAGGGAEGKGGDGGGGRDARGNGHDAGSGDKGNGVGNGALLDALSYEDLQDLGKVVALADYVLTKHQDRREMRSILKEFVEIVSDSAGSLEAIDDEVSELILEAEDYITRIKGMHARISDRSDIGDAYGDGPDYSRHQTGVINLTKSQKILT